jgi:3-oxoadipate enol-lactonase
MWEPQLAPLADAGLRVLAYDHRGHGASPVEAGPYTIDELGHDVLAMLEARGIDAFSVAGVSLGGMVAVWLAAHAPERVTALVPCATSPFMAGPLWSERASAVRAAGTVAAISHTVVRNWLTPEYAEERPDLVAWLVDLLDATPAEGYAGCCEAIDAMDLRDALAQIRAPTLVIAGDQDPSTPAEDHARRIADGIAGARFELLSPSAHLVGVQQPERVTELIRDHVRAAAA